MVETDWYETVTMICSWGRGSTAAAWTSCIQGPVSHFPKPNAHRHQKRWRVNKNVASKICFNHLGFLAFNAPSRTCPLWPSQGSGGTKLGSGPKGCWVRPWHLPGVPRTKGQKRCGHRGRVKGGPGRGQEPVAKHVHQCDRAAGAWER
ncbi:hypothetical protein HJG60_008090 [Phyllostomus discolor]|uniref:Uncharacterized protein n=1 Tax=Phyllostomus discolor TaxID=89673 RepID=A0A834ERY1_9CHIR|nr:hypothetical protein HJG60_008090 [Phyllostomus discolor]